ncbi:hypothetical protein HY251_07120 [bacterium]|nr:hypothetical protein [bacterium]
MSADSSLGGRRSILLFLLLFSILVSWWLVVRARNLEEGVAAELRSEAKRGLGVRRKQLWNWKKYEETGFVRMGPPREGEWLARFPELGQTFLEYARDCRNKRGPGRETIALRLLGPLSDRARAAVLPVRRFCEAFFGLPVRVLEERPLPEAAFRKDRGQYDVTPLLSHLEAEVQQGELIHAALCDRDLCWIGELDNFCFGGASFQRPVGVYSLHRFGLGENRETVYRRRAFQLVAHELGHILGMAHCIYYKCLMNGTNSLEESDGAPCHLCPVCEEKLVWNLGLDRPGREGALSVIFKDEGLDDEAAWAEAHAARIAGAVAPVTTLGR